MRVAFLLTRFPVLSQTFVINQITGLLRRGVDVEILAGRPTDPLPAGGPVVEHGLLARTHWVDLPAAPLSQFVSALGRAGQAVAREPRKVLSSLNVTRYGFPALSGQLMLMSAGLPRSRYDVIHAHFGPTGMLGMALRDQGVIAGRLCTVFHGFDMTQVLRIFGKRHYARLFSSGDLFMPISDRWRSQLLALGAPAERTHTHHMGIDVESFRPSGAPRSGKRRIELVSVGRLVAKKGFADAITAIGLLPGNIDLRYRIIGSGPLQKSLAESVKRQGLTQKIEIVGAKDHTAVRQALFEADILMAPSVTAPDGDQEGIPVTIMEAMAMELPVLATYHSGIPELVVDGETGYLVPEQNPRQLAEKLQKLVAYEALRIQFGRAGRRVVCKYYDIEKLNDALLEQFSRLSA